MTKHYQLDNKREFLVQGSEELPYKVVFTKTGDNITARCSCKAANNGMHCKHRLNILSGLAKGIVSNNEQDVEIVAGWLEGSDIESALKDLGEAEEAMKKAKSKVSALKKMLAKALAD